MKKILIIALALIITACASSKGFDRGALREQISDEKIITEEDIKNALELKPQLPDPFKLAIYFEYPRSEPTWSWLSQDKEQLLTISSDLKAKGLVSDVFILNDAILEGADLKSIRLGAARAGADAVLIVKGANAIDIYNNALAATYFFLFPAFFIPGTVADGLFIINASMWDVRNQYLYLSSEAEGKSHVIRPAFFINRTKLFKEAKSDAISELTKDIVNRLSIMNSKKD
jgi:hypothetical protein